MNTEKLRLIKRWKVEDGTYRNPFFWRINFDPSRIKYTTRVLGTHNNPCVSCSAVYDDTDAPRNDERETHVGRLSTTVYGRRSEQQAKEDAMNELLIKWWDYRKGDPYYSEYAEVMWR